MTQPVSFADLQDILQRHTEPLPDYRNKGSNTRYRIPGAVLGALDLVFGEVFERLESHHLLAPFWVLDGQLLVALDGTNYFASKTIYYQNGIVALPIIA